MNEADWLAAKDPLPMLDYLEGKASQRKFRLFACACARRFWRLYRYRAPRDAVELAERYAEGLADAGAVEAMRETAEMSAGTAPEFEVFAYQAAADTLAETAVEAARNAHEHARQHAVREAAYEVIPGENEARATSAASAAERLAQCELVREVFGNPFRPIVIEAHWLAGANGAPGAMARMIHDEARFEELPYLADALEDAGCSDDELLDHLRRPDGHARGCWALDVLLGLK
jgi:hypothetical protein